MIFNILNNSKVSRCQSVKVSNSFHHVIVGNLWEVDAKMREESEMGRAVEKEKMG